MLTHRFVYPPNRGDRIRSYHLLRRLAKDFRVTLASTNDEPLVTQHRQHVEAICQEVLVGRVDTPARAVRGGIAAMRGRSLTEGMFHHAELADRIIRRQTASPFDVAFVYCSGMFGYVRNPAFEGTPVVTDLVDVDSQKWRQLARRGNPIRRGVYRFESSRVRKLEREIVRRSDAVTVISDQEARSLSRIEPASTTSCIVIGNGVDIDFFRPVDPPMPAADAGRPMRLLFVGVLDYRPNVESLQWFCRSVLPTIRRPVTLRIVGRRPGPAIHALAACRSVDVIGEVDDVRPQLRDADVVIAPLRVARGVQNKVLEAMACGKPVVASTPAATGIDANQRTELLVADTPRDFSAAIESLTDADLRSRIGRAARRYVVDHAGWDAASLRCSRLLQKVA